MATTAPDMDVFLDNQPMNDEELTRLHESTLQMFRSNKIGPKNAFDIVLIDYLPAIFEATSFDDDHINNFQSVGTTLETSAKIYAARIDSLYSETRKAQSILRSTNENLNRLIDDEDEDGDEADNNHNDDGTSPRRISNNKKIRLLLKRKKSVVTDRTKLLRKNRNDEFRPIMVNQFFLSAMHNDTIMLSELYDKMNISSNTVKTSKPDANDILASSASANDFACDPLYVDTTNGSVGANDSELSPASELNTSSKSSQFLTPASSLSMTTTLLSTPARSRTNSLSSNSSILINAASLLTDTPDEYSYLDSSKVNAFMNELSTSTKLDDVIPSPTKAIRKRRLTVEYPFPFLVEQAKKQRVTPKKLQAALTNQHLLSRPLSPEYIFPSLDDTFVEPPALPNDAPLPSFSQESIPVGNTPQISKRQREVDFRRLQTDMHRLVSERFESDDDLNFSEVFSLIHHGEQRTTSSASNVGICFAALLNNAVRHQLVLQSNDVRDDIRILPPPSNHKP